MKKHTRTINSLLLVAALLFLSCVTGDEYETVMGTDIPTSELRKNETISAEAFKAATEGKYYVLMAYYCQWKGNSLRYLQTGEDYYGIEGHLNVLGDSGDWYIQFEESIMHYYNDLDMDDYRYAFTHDDGTMTIPAIEVNGVSDGKLHSCKMLYVDEKNILAETDVYRPRRMSREARQAAAAADFVLLRFVAVDPPNSFIGFTDWHVSNLTYE